MRRDFTATAPNQLWVTDLTLVPTWAGIAYVCFIIDACSRVIVGWRADNAAVESFFSPLPKNVLNRRRWTSREELRLTIITWMGKAYHRRRRQGQLDGLTPIEYETLPEAAHAA